MTGINDQAQTDDIFLIPAISLKGVAVRIADLMAERYPDRIKV